MVMEAEQEWIVITEPVTDQKPVSNNKGDTDCCLTMTLTIVFLANYLEKLMKWHTELD